MIKHQILKSVAVVALVSLMSVPALAVEASDGIEGYRDALGILDAQKWKNKGEDALEKEVKKLNKELDDGMGSITDGVKGLNANKILNLGGGAGKYIGRANNGSSSFKVLENFGFGFGGTTGDKWLDYFYGSGVKTNLDDYLQGDLTSQLSQAGSAGSSAVDEYNENALETYWRAAVAKSIYDRTGIKTSDYWMVDYVPAVGVGQILVNKDESLGSMSGILSAGENIKDAALSMKDLSEMHKDFSFGDANEVNDIGQKLMENAKEEAGRMVSLDAMRFMNEDALEHMNDMKDSVPWIGAGIPTMDILNLIVGMYNVDSVYATTDQNAKGKTDPISKTEGIQVGEFKSCVTSGKSARTCCATVTNGNPSGVANGAVTYQECCKAMTGNASCRPIAVQAAIDECEEKQGQINADNWKMCDFNCKNTDFGDLIHREMKDGEIEDWDEDLVADLLEECGAGESDWAPSPTVLTSAELAAVVPETIKNTLD